MTLEPRVFTAVAIPALDEEPAAARQVDIVLDGLEQAGDSFELRIFLNDPDANASTEPIADAGYAGSIHVYGYGGMLPDDSDSGPAPAHMPMSRRRIATAAIRAAAAEGKQMTVTLVPVAYGAIEPDVRLENVHVSVLAHE